MSNRSRRFIWGGFILLAAVVVWLDRGSEPGRFWGLVQSHQQLQTGDIQKYDGKTFIVLKIVDGDTIDISVPDGGSGFTMIRLWGVDTPETKHPQYPQAYFGPEASEFTTNLTLGKKVKIYLDTHRPTRGKYGRLLGYVQLPDRRFLNEVLLEDGFAYADTRFRHYFYNKYKQYEAAARSQKKGLWENVTFEQLPDWVKRKRPGLIKQN